MRMEIGLEMELGMETDMNGVREGDGNGDGHEDGDGVVAWHREGGGEGNRWGMGIHEPGAGIGLAMGHRGGCGPWGEPSSVPAPLLFPQGPRQPLPWLPTLAQPCSDAGSTAIPCTG